MQDIAKTMKLLKMCDTDVYDIFPARYGLSSIPDNVLHAGLFYHITKKFQTQPGRKEQLIKMAQEDEHLRRLYDEYQADPVKSMSKMEKDFQFSLRALEAQQERSSLKLDRETVQYLIDNPSKGGGFGALNTKIDCTEFEDSDFSNLLPNVTHRFRLGMLSIANPRSSDHMNSLISQGKPLFFKIEKSAIPHLSICPQHSVCDIVVSDSQASQVTINGKWNPDDDVNISLSVYESDIASIACKNLGHFYKLSTAQTTFQNLSLSGSSPKNVFMQSMSLRELPQDIQKITTLAEIDVRDNDFSSLEQFTNFAGTNIILKDNNLRSPSIEDLEKIVKNGCKIDIGNNGIGEVVAAQIEGLITKLEQEGIYDKIRYNTSRGHRQYMDSIQHVEQSATTAHDVRLEGAWMAVLKRTKYKKDSKLIEIINAHPEQKKIKEFIINSSHAIGVHELKLSLEDILGKIKDFGITPDPTSQSLQNMSREERQRWEQVPKAMLTILQATGDCATPVNLALCHNYMDMCLDKGQEVPQALKTNVAINNYIQNIFNKHGISNESEAIEASQGMLNTLLLKGINYTDPENIRTLKRPRIILGQRYRQEGSNSLVPYFALNQAADIRFAAALDEFYLGVCKTDSRGRLLVTKNGCAIADDTKIKRIIRSSYSAILEARQENANKTSRAEHIYRTICEIPDIWLDSWQMPLSHITTERLNCYKELIDANVSKYKQGQEREFAKMIEKEYLAEEMAIGSNLTPAELIAISAKEEEIPNSIMSRVDISFSNLATALIENHPVKNTPDATKQQSTQTEEKNTTKQQSTQTTEEYPSAEKSASTAVSKKKTHRIAPSVEKLPEIAKPPRSLKELESGGRPKWNTSVKKQSNKAKQGTLLVSKQGALLARHVPITRKTQAPNVDHGARPSSASILRNQRSSSKSPQGRDARF